MCWCQVFHFTVPRTAPTTINQGWVKRKNRGAEILLFPFNHFAKVKSTVSLCKHNFSLTYLSIFTRLLKASERYKKALEQVFIIIFWGTKYLYMIFSIISQACFNKQHWNQILKSNEQSYSYSVSAENHFAETDVSFFEDTSHWL